MAHAVTLMIASRGSSIFGSGTVSQRTSPLPCQHNARIRPSCDSTWGERLSGTRAVGSAGGARGSGAGGALSGYRLAGAPAASRSRYCRVTSGRCRSDEHTSELQSLMRISYAVLCLKNINDRYNTKIINSYTIDI